MAASKRRVVDIHAHLYPPSYLSLLSSRTEPPRLLSLPQGEGSPRLIILPTDNDPSLPESARGRPVGPEYSSIEEKLNFMNTHEISTSVISLANPWLDFLPAKEGADVAIVVNNEMEQLCASAEPGRLYAFGTLPLSASTEEVAKEVLRLQTLQHVRGVILGTSGLGRGLDDPLLDPIWAALEQNQTLIFLHPHYGLPAEVFGPRAQEYGHVLPLSLGFPMETTIAFIRMHLSGVFDRYPKLKLLIAHAGGTVPFLAGRVQSCVHHERHFRDAEGWEKHRKTIWEVLKKNVWLDAVTYSDTGVKAAAEVVGTERVLFGTDHPFFPPLDNDTKDWLSVRTNVDAVCTAFHDNEKTVENVLGHNAIELLHL
ncbi:MAG: hypothetical protein Q9190_007792 [Brigantiaea leucoxantha]